MTIEKMTIEEKIQDFVGNVIKDIDPTPSTFNFLGVLAEILDELKQLPDDRLLEVKAFMKTQRPRLVSFARITRVLSNSLSGAAYGVACGVAGGVACSFFSSPSNDYSSLCDDVATGALAGILGTIAIASSKVSGAREHSNRMREHHNSFERIEKGLANELSRLEECSQHRLQHRLQHM